MSFYGKQMGLSMALGAATIVSIAGCGQRPTVIGDWQEAGTSDPRLSSTTTMHFGADGVAAELQSVQMGPIITHTHYSGHYTVADDIVTVSMTSMTIGLDASTVQAMNSRVGTNIPGGDTTRPVSQTATYRFVRAGTTLTLTDQQSQRDLVLTQSNQ